MDCSGEYRWFSKVIWEEKARQIDCLVDLSKTFELDDGFWLVEDKGGLTLRRAEELGEGVVLGKGINWSTDF